MLEEIDESRIDKTALPHANKMHLADLLRHHKPLTDQAKANLEKLFVKRFKHSKPQRNAEIIAKWQAGASFAEIGRQYLLSRQRIEKIVKEFKKAIDAV